MRIPLQSLSLFSLTFLAVIAQAEDRVDYVRSIKPLLAARCFACHGALQQKSSLRLDTVGLMKEGGEGGPVIVPSKSGESALIARITATGKKGQMPPKSEGEPLKESEIALLRAWIDQGANAPPDEKPETDPKDHWAFKTPVKPKVEGKGNPIDVLIEAKRKAAGVVAAREADREVLLRRVYLDLTGLPPTREEIEKARNDKQEDWYEKVVERLLSSKQYGERWGRHWMDIWRYSDWWGLGAEVRNSQKHIWHWRDYIIESLNGDKGYDQMIREMLAADELYPEDADKLRGTGYLARGYFKFNRNTWMEDVVEHTSKSFLGLTVNCAKCHDHKYDPITQRDFYRMRAFFEPYQVRTDMVPGEPNFEKNGVPRVFDCNLEMPTYLFVRGDEKNPVKTKPIPPGLPEILVPDGITIKPVALPLDAYTPGLRPSIYEAHIKSAERDIAAAKEALQQARKALTSIEKTVAPAPEKPMTPEIKASLSDDFSKARPDLWEMKLGKWNYKDGKLVQEQDGPNRGVLRLKPQQPLDFQARLKFSILGGQTYKSVGLTFDVAGDNETLVYLSGYNAGPKVQVSYKQGTGHVYPPGAMQARAVKLNEPQELLIRVRGQLVNVAVNGQHVVAYQLPVARKAGAVELITYDAKTALTGFEIAPLPADARLVEAGTTTTTPISKPTSAEEAKLAILIAEKALAAAEAQPLVIKTKAAADRAKYQQPPPTNAKELAREAAKAEKLATVATAEEAVARLELQVAKSGPTKPASEKQLATARTALATAKKALENPGETYVALRGSLKTPESNLESEASRNKPFPATSTGRRSALAKWIADARNPLTPRVAVNHIWTRHMGKPLVATVFDFGRKGAAPTHPELLDYLAVEFVEKGWSMKHLHKLIVTSNTYRLTSSGAKPQAADPENRLYWRMNPVRMEAQVIRDSLLYLAGDLDLTMGGPSIPANSESRRRSLYFVHSHNEYNKFLSIFDDANVLECYRRAESVVPQQALALENSQLAIATAEKIAKRLTETTDAAFIRAAFETVLGTAPTTEEQTECEKAMSELKALAAKEKKPDGTMRAKVTLLQALLNHNDFVTIR